MPAANGTALVDISSLKLNIYAKYMALPDCTGVQIWHTPIRIFTVGHGTNSHTATLRITSLRISVAGNGPPWLFVSSCPQREMISGTCVLPYDKRDRLRVAQLR